MNLSEFIEWLRGKGYVVASVCNDPESTQDLMECNYTDELIEEFESELINEYKRDN